MDNKKKYTNQDLYQALGEIKQITLATKEQAEKTNGRVTKLEKWQNEVIAVEVYNDKHNSDNGIDYTKIVMYALGLVGTALGVVAVALK